MGFTEIPEGGCQSSSTNSNEYQNILCDFEKEILNGAAYEPLLEWSMAPAGYYRDTENLTNYRQSSSYLAKLNNEGDPNSTLSKKQK